MNILLVQTSFLGDTILSTPVISGLNKLYPKALIWMMTTPLSSSLVKRDPLLSGVISYDKRGKDSGLPGLIRMSQKIRKMKFAKVYSLHRSFRTSLLVRLTGIPERTGCEDTSLSFVYHEKRKRDLEEHDVIRNLSILSNESPVESLDTEMRLFAPAKEEISQNIKERLPKTGRYAVLVPGSVWKTKMWHWQGYRSIAHFLINMRISVVLLGALSDKDVCKSVAKELDIIDLSGETSISEAMYVMKNAKLSVCNDSMSLHMSSAFKVPTVAIFCATSPDFGYGPWKNRSIVVERTDLDCKPCRSHGSNTCPTGTEACMKDLSPDKVIDAIKELLKIQ